MRKYIRKSGDQEPERSGFPVGVVLWFLLMVAGGAGLWVLIEYFPGQLSGDGDKAVLVRNVSILLLISSGVLFARRFRPREILRNIAIWLLLAVVLVVGYTYQNELGTVARRVVGELVPSRAMETPTGELVLKQSDNGHFHVTALANNTRIQFMIDTGASDITLNLSDAKRIGIDPASLHFTNRYNTANGTVYGAPWKLDRLSIGPFEFQNVSVSINETEMSSSLLGMSFLDRLGSFEIRGRTLILRR